MAGESLCGSPLRTEPHVCHPAFDIAHVECVALAAEDACDVAELAFGLAELCPFELGGTRLAAGRHRAVELRAVRLVRSW